MAAALPEGYRRQAFDTLPSTNSEAFAAARAGDPGFLWITAGEQTEGRGRRGRVWVGGKGNLAASLLLIDPAPLTVAATVSFVAGVALHQAVVDATGPAIAERLKLKWPNDLLLDRFKVAGIAVEGDELPSGRFAVVIGIGVNCRSHPDAGTIHPASDFSARGIPLDAEALFDRLALCIAEELVRWDRGENFGPIRGAWLARSVGLGEQIRVNLAERTIDGRFDTLDEDGRLVLTRLDGARETVSAGDVFFGRGAVTVARHADELVFLPLGGVGEIGMNLGLYGYGPPNDRTWVAVDFGVAFAGPDLPGVDLIFPDIAYLEEERRNLVGILITHAHEDHFGALIDLWRRLRVPVYATAFAAGLLMAKLASEPGSEAIPVTIVAAGKPFTVGPFGVEYIAVDHSIPEPNAIALRTPLGLVVHSGDWKLDEAPVIGEPTDVARLRALGEEGVLAFVSDSTNALRDGRSPSETEVARELAEIVATAKGRVAFTTFASNVGRIRSMALAAAKARREVVVVGRALRRAIDVAAELGYLDGLPPFREEDEYLHLPRNKVVALLTGSQGEPRAALARVVDDDHKNVVLDRGDIVVFSSRSIPGNEVAINRIVNGLFARGIRVITDRDRLVHVSGHPRRDEMRAMYGWLKPRIAIPVHGEAMHLSAHADLARDLGVPTVLTIANGAMVRLAPEPVEQVDAVEAGRIYKDGWLIGDLEAVGVPERRKLAFAGLVGVALVLDERGELETEPEVMLTGLPRADASGRPLVEAVVNAVHRTIDSLPRPRRRDAEVVREAVRRSVRAAVAELWGKKPVCTVFVAVV